MKTIKQLSLIAIVAIVSNAVAAGYPTTFVRSVQADGSEYLLADSTGKTLYTFASDPADSTPVCDGKCAERWPPILLSDAEATSLQAPFTFVTRNSGLKQLAQNGKALYTYFLDRNPGQNLGDNVGNVWSDVHQEVDVAGCKETDFVESTTNNPTITINPDHTYSPKCLRVKKGSKLNFTASSLHPMAAMNDVLNFANPLSTLGAQTANFSQIFMAPGLFGFFCEHHGNIDGTGMAGAIEVVE